MGLDFAVLYPRFARSLSRLAERAGFEPAIPCGMPAFQASALGHYATSPQSAYRRN